MPVCTARCDHRGRRVQEWEKNVLAAPVAKERSSFHRAWLAAFDIEEVSGKAFPAGQPVSCLATGDLSSDTCVGASP